jgi:integrase
VRVHKVKPLTLEELEVVVAAMPEQRQAMTLLAAWCAMRFGELAELRRRDINQTTGTIQVRRPVVRVGGETIVGTPKSDAGTPDIAIPPHLMPLLKEHLKKHVGSGKDALLFPGADGGHLNPSTLYGRKPTKKNLGYGFTPPAPPPTGRTFAGTTLGTRAPSWRRRPVPRWPSSWVGSGARRPAQRSDTSTRPRGVTRRSRSGCRR